EARWAESRRSLVTVGLTPPYASTAFGYIQVGPALDGQGGAAVHQVKAFVEKPDLQTAERYLKSGDFLWNLGLFAWPIDVLFDEGESVLIGSRNCMIHSPSKLVAAVGLEDMVVIETDDAILICPKARSQDVKLIVDRLKQLGKTEYL